MLIALMDRKGLGIPSVSTALAPNILRFSGLAFMHNRALNRALQSGKQSTDESLTNTRPRFVQRNNYPSGIIYRQTFYAEILAIVVSFK